MLYLVLKRKLLGLKIEIFEDHKIKRWSSSRDILLRRLREKSSDDKLKISIMELLVVSVQTQPALFELTLNLEPVLEDNIPTVGDNYL